MTNNQKIETSREIRLWIGQIIVPTLTCVSTMILIPEVRQAVVTKTKEVKQSIKNKFQKRA